MDCLYHGYYIENEGVETFNFEQTVVHKVCKMQLRQVRTTTKRTVKDVTRSPGENINMPVHALHRV